MNQEAYAHIKETILSRIGHILAEVYHEEFRDLSRQNISALLAFKGDPYLNELRLALERMTRGEYGTCILCKDDIDASMLLTVPTAHFCENCNRVFQQRSASVRSRGTHHARL